MRLIALRAIMALPVLTIVQAVPAQAPVPSHRKFAESTALMKTGRFEPALASWNDYLKAYPADPQAPIARLNLTNCLFRTNRFTEAAASAEELLGTLPQASPHRATCRLMAALSRLEQGRPTADKTALEGALGHFAALARDFAGKPEAEEAGFRAGEALELLGRPVEAINELTTWIDAHGKSPLVADARFMIGRCHYRAGANDQAVAAFTAFLAPNPTGVRAADARFLLGLALSKLDGRGAEALAQLDAAIQGGHPHLDRVHYERGRIYASQGKKTEGAAAFACAAEIANSSLALDSRLHAARLLAEAGNHPGAIDQCQKGLAAGPDPGREQALLFHLAWSQSKLDDPKAAATTCEDLVRRFPDGEHTQRALALLANICRDLKDWKGCQSAWERLARGSKPELRLPSLLAAGEAAWKANDEAAALAQYETACKEGVGTAVAARAEFGRGCIHTAKNRLNEAADAFRRAQAIGLNTEAEAQAGYELGEVLVRLEDLEAAADQFVKSAGAHEAHTEWAARSWFRAGMILETLSQDDQAIRCYQQLQALLHDNHSHSLYLAADKQLAGLRSPSNPSK